jgi:hypothetical protein
MRPAQSRRSLFWLGTDLRLYRQELVTTCLLMLLLQTWRTAVDIDRQGVVERQGL